MKYRRGEGKVNTQLVKLEKNDSIAIVKIDNPL
jgi:hypothetical protein